MGTQVRHGFPAAVKQWTRVVYLFRARSSQCVREDQQLRRAAINVLQNDFLVDTRGEVASSGSDAVKDRPFEQKEEAFPRVARTTRLLLELRPVSDVFSCQLTRAEWAAKRHSVKV